MHSALVEALRKEPNGAVAASVLKAVIAMVSAAPWGRLPDRLLRNLLQALLGLLGRLNLDFLWEPRFAAGS